MPELRDQIRSIEQADSWATDAHKWLNVPYDSGLAWSPYCRAPRRDELQGVMLQRGSDEERRHGWVQSSRRAHVVPIYALIKRWADGIAEMVRGNVASPGGWRPGYRGARRDDLRTVLSQVLVQFECR